MARKFTLQFPPTAWIPVPGVDGSGNPYGPAFVANTSSDTPAIPRVALAFDDGNDEAAVSVPFMWPAEYVSTDVTGTVFFHTTDGTGTVAWTLQVEKSETGPIDLKDGAAGFDINVNDFTATAAAAGGGVTEVTLTISNLDSIAAGDLVYLKLFRDTLRDVATDDANMVLFTLHEGS